MTAASRTAQARSGAGVPPPLSEIWASASASALVNSRIWARHTLKCIRSMPVDTLSSVPCPTLRSASAVGGDDVFGVDRILLRLRHFLDRADCDLAAAIDHDGMALVAKGLDLHLRRGHISAVRPAVGFVDDHALRVLAGERLVECNVAGGFHGAREEARIEQVQDRVLDAADILIDWQQPIDHGASGRLLLVPG